MTGKVSVGKGDFPYRGESLIQFVFEHQLQQDQKIVLLNKEIKGQLFKLTKLHDFQGKEKQTLVIGPTTTYEKIVLVGAGSKNSFSQTKLRDLLAKGLHLLKKERITQVNLFISPEFGQDFFSLGKILSLALNLVNYRFTKYKGEKERKQLVNIEKLIVYELPANKLAVFNQGVVLGEKISQGIMLARNLVNEPGSVVHPETLEQTAFEIEKKSKGRVTVEILDEDECRNLNMGAFLGVAQGSEKKPRFIILKYKNNSKVKNQKSKPKSICLIGKSITFDSGGLSLKPAEAMFDMKIDMAGGATVLGVFEILARLDDELDIKTDVYGLLPACENMPSGKALRPGDVVTALNGKTVEVLHTDAEGRLTLADGLSYAEKYIKPDVLIDLATLTGAVLIGLGNEITALMGNNRLLNEKFLKICQEQGEMVWELPLYKSYLEAMKSDMADIKNISNRGFGAGTITAGLFLNEFVGRTDWIHLDIAESAYNKSAPKGIIANGGTGWGILSLIEFIRNY